MTTTRGPAVVLAGALDTKHAEYGFVRDRLQTANIATLVIDTGIVDPPGIEPDLNREAVAHAGGADLGRLARGGDRNTAVAAMAAGAATLIEELHAQGNVSGVIVLGGSNAGFIMSQIADTLPIGVPKLLTSTIVAGDTRPYVGTSDLMMLYPVVDLAGLNSISIPVLSRTADAMVGMLNAAPGPAPANSAGRQSIGCTMFGVTTTCVAAVQNALECQGSEVQVFHANGTGGRTYERMVHSGFFDAVTDITTTELADELVGGVCTAGPDRLTAAALAGIPQVVSVGALDMVNFGAPDSIPEEFQGRLLHAHNPAVTLMRTNAAENVSLARIIATRLNQATNHCEMLIPSKGFSQISVTGQPFHDPEADQALIDTLQQELDQRVPLHIIDAAINDPAFGDEIVAALKRVTASP